jgi:hypothetical protein
VRVLPAAILGFAVRPVPDLPGAHAGRMDLGHGAAAPVNLKEGALRIPRRSRPESTSTAPAVARRAGPASASSIIVVGARSARENGMERALGLDP